MKKLIFTFAFLFSLSMLGQEIDTTRVNTLDAIELNGVRATKLTPITQKTLSRKEIQLNYRGEEVSQILDKTPSIISNSDAGTAYGYTYFRMRGMDQARVNMTLNGVPLNEPEDQGVYFSNYPNFMDNVKSVQIQRGVGTSSNGVASYAGSINFTSPNGWDEEKSLEVNYGSYNTKRVSGTYSTGLSDNNTSLYASASTYGTDGYRYNSGSKGYSAFVSGGSFGDKDIFKFTAFYGHSENEMAWLGVSEADIATNPKTNYNSEDADDAFTQGMIQLNYTRKFSPYHTLNTTAYYNKLKGNYDYFGGDTEEPLRLNSDMLGLISNFNYTKGSIKFDGGVATHTYERDHSLVGYHENSGNKNEVSFYSKLNYTLGNLILYGDLQYRLVNFKYDGDVSIPTQKWDFINPRVGATYVFTDNFNIYGYVGKSHREPNRTDLFGGNDNLSELNPKEPEEVVDYELGFNITDSRFKLQANLFYMDFKNELSLTGEFGPNSLPLVGSFDKSYRMGVELDASYELVKYLTIYYNESHSRNRIKVDGVEFEPLYTPNVIRNVRLGYNDGKFNASISSKHHSESFIDLANDNTTPKFTKFDAKVGYDFGKVYVGLDAVNITSEDYYTNGYNYGDNYYYANAPFNMYGTVGLKF